MSVIYWYVMRFLESLVISGLYMYVKGDCYKDNFFKVFMKFVLFYIIIHDVARLLKISEPLVTLIFIGRIIGVYIETYDECLLN